ncbi:hypothetical protein Tco_0962428 [Tanacetum coccineum]
MAIALFESQYIGVPCKSASSLAVAIGRDGFYSSLCSRRDIIRDDDHMRERFIVRLHYALDGIRIVVGIAQNNLANGWDVRVFSDSKLRSMDLDAKVYIYSQLTISEGDAYDYDSITQIVLVLL